MIMQPAAKLASAMRVLPFREGYREEMDCQIVHDSIHRREGWTLIYELEVGGVAVGFGSVAIGGPWKDKPTLFEFYLLPEHRARAFEVFECLLATTNVRFMEIQSNDTLLAVMLHTYARSIESEKIVFRDKLTTALSANGVHLRTVTSDEETQIAVEQCQGGAEWEMELDGQSVGKGGIMFHYNRAYADVYIEVSEPLRRRGLGSYFVQELKRAAYDLGTVPAARCNTTNVASRRTLQKAGFVPFAHMLTGTISGQ